MAWPTTTISTTDMDAGTDNAASARAAVLLNAQNTNAMRSYLSGPEVALAAAATVDIGGQASNRVLLNSGGGATITSLGGNYSGQVVVRVGVACTLNYNATTIITPGNQNLVLRVGDLLVCQPKATSGTADGWVVMPAPWTGRLALGGATPDADAMLTIGRNDTGNEGGQMSLCRASDNALAYAWDVYYNAGPAEDVARLIDKIAGATRLMVDSSGRVGVNQLAALTAALDVNGDLLRMRVDKTPASATAAGNAGEWCSDANYFYKCTALNTWKRVAIATW